MAIFKPEGTIVPELPIRESNVINHYWMSYNEFATLEEVFCQRNTEGRLSKAKKHLSKLIPEHCVVAVCKLTKPATINGKRYKAGAKFRVDSNTRALNWKSGGSDSVPQEVLVIEYSFDNPDRIRECYNTFDSPDATERNQEKFYGIISGMYNYTPLSSKFQKGQILCGLNKACHFYYPETWNQFSIRVTELPGQVGAFLEEIKVLDSIIKTSVHWDQALVCLALMALKKYGCDDDKVLEGLRIIDERELTGKVGKSWDGLTHIIWEWTNENIFKNKTTTWHKDAGLNRTVAYCCYWFDKYMADVKGQHIAGKWEEIPTKWKDEQVRSLNHFFNISKVTA